MGRFHRVLFRVVVVVVLANLVVVCGGRRAGATAATVVGRGGSTSVLPATTPATPATPATPKQQTGSSWRRSLVSRWTNLTRATSSNLTTSPEDRFVFSSKGRGVEKLNATSTGNVTTRGVAEVTATATTTTTPSADAAARASQTNSSSRTRPPLWPARPFFLGRGRLPDNSNETTDAVLSSPTEARTSLDAESSPLPRHTSEQDEEEERGAATAANRSTTTTIDQKSAPSSSLDPVAPAPELTPPNTTTASPDTTTLIHTTTAAEEEPVTTTISSLSAATPNGNTTALPVDDSTTTESPSSPSQQQPQQQQVLVLGGTPYRVMRPGRHASAGAVPPAMPRPSPQTGLLFAELAAAFLQTGFRLWILTFLTSRLSHQEETILPIQRFVWERLNDRYTRDSSALASVVHAPPLGVSKRRWRRQHVRHHHHLHHLTTTSRPPALLPTTLRETFTRTVVVVPLEADKLDVEYLTDVISFLVQQHRAHAFGSQPRKHVQPKWWWQQQEGKGNNQTREEVEEEQLFPKELEVVLLVKSGGGSVHSFGLAAAQVRRLAREPNIRLTASVDMYAASGGYMIASQAHRLLAAPFALLGSIGVIVETLNFNEIARKYGIHPVTIKSGKNKNPLSTYGAITAKDEREEQQRLVKVHEAFKELVVEGRPVLADSIHKVADGSVFAGQEALDTQLIDQIQTSEEYIMERIQAGDRVLRLHRSIKPKFTRRVHLSPLDILPHLRTWLGEWGLLARLQDPSVLLTLTSALEMVRHLVRQYGDSLGGV